MLASLAPQVYSALPYMLAPVIGNPVLMALGRVGGGTAVSDLPQALASALTGMLPMLGKLAEVLPQDTLLWKLELLQSGCAYMDTRYSQVTCQSMTTFQTSGDHTVYLRVLTTTETSSSKLRPSASFATSPSQSQSRRWRRARSSWRPSRTS